MIEIRPEICRDCGATRDRDWVVKHVAKGTPVPRGFRVVKRGGAWTTVTAPTRFTSLCLCDTP